MRLALVLAFALVIWILSATSYSQVPSSSPFDQDWILVADSDWILRGRLKVPKKELDEAIRTGKGEYIQLKTDVINIIKVPVDFPIEHMEFSYWSGKADYMPSPRDVRSLDGREVLMFSHEGFVAQDKRAIRPYETKKAENLKQEVYNQHLIVESFAKLPAARPDKFEGPVKDLINKMLVKETQQEAVYALQRLGPRAAPSIIRLMDDRRPLPLDHTSFLNTSGKGFEAIMHYGPKVALEALAVVLGTLTGESFFGEIANGGTDEKRKAVVNAWRVYLHYRISEEAKPKPACLGSGSGPYLARSTSTRSGRTATYPRLRFHH
jgi:hypothetical protein